MSKMTEEEILDQAGEDCAQFILHITQCYKGYERQMAEMLTLQLAGYVSIVASKPQDALDEVAATIKATNWDKIRAGHFGYTLGVKEPVKGKDIKTKIVHMGELRGKPKSPEPA